MKPKRYDHSELDWIYHEYDIVKVYGYEIKVETKGG